MQASYGYLRWLPGGGYAPKFWVTHDSNFAERERPAALDLCSPALRDERPPFATASCARSRPADAARRCLAVAVL